MRTLSLDIDWQMWFGRWGSSLALVPLCAIVATEGGGFGLGTALWALSDGFLLIVHEAGHFFFRFFGRFLTIAGGTILQLALPAVFVFQGVYWHSKWGTQLALLLLGQSFVDVAVYAADAQDQALPLIGNLGPESHDWHNLLVMTGLLDWTPVVAGVFYAGAIVAWGVMLLVPLRIE